MNIIGLPSLTPKAYVVGTKKTCLNETVLLSTRLINKKITSILSYLNAQNLSLNWYPILLSKYLPIFQMESYKTEKLCDLFQMDMPDFPMGIGMIEDSSDSFHKGKN